MVGHFLSLLRDRPEQEQNLLRLLSNKLGDSDGSVASKTSFLLLQLLQTHSMMKVIVTREVSSIVLKPGTNENARYYGTITLNQIILERDEPEVANRLIEIYFEMFKDLLKKSDTTGGSGKVESKRKHGQGNKAREHDKNLPLDSETDNKMLAAILTGINRAFPFADIKEAE